MTEQKKKKKKVKRVWVGWMSFIDGEPCAFDLKKEMACACVPEESERWEVKKVIVRIL
jgi:hypothetical protein